MAKKELNSFIASAEDKKRLDQVSSRKTKSDQFFTRYVTDTDRWYKMYRNLITKPDNEFRSKVSVPVGFWTIETTVPRMVAKKHAFTMTARDDKDPKAIEYAIQAKQYYDYVLDQIKFRRKTRVLAKDMKVTGSGFWRYGWDPEKELPFLQNTPLRLLRPDADWSQPGDIQGCKFVIYITRLTREELANNANYSEALKNITPEMWAQIPTTKSLPQEEQSKKVRLAARGLNTENTDPVEKEYEVWEHWGFIDGKRRLVVILANQYIIRDTEAPYDFWPVGIAINTEDPDNLLGIGDIEPVADIIDDINTNRRMRTDNKNIRTNSMFEVQRSAGILDEEFVWQPGGKIMSNILNGVNPIAIPDTTQGSVEEEMIALQQIEKVTGTPAQLQGQLAATASDSSGLLNRTATAYKGSEVATSVRFKYQSESLDMCVEEMLTNVWKIIQKNVTGDQLVRVIGEDGVKKWMTIPEEAIKREYVIDIEYGSAALEDEEVKWTKALAKFNTLAAIFPESATFFLKDLLVAAGDKNVMEIVQAVAASREKAAAMGNLPKPPQINVSLGGEDMNDMLVVDLLKNYFQLSPIATTPEMFGKSRMLMQGQTPEDLERDKVKIQLFEAITKAQQNDQQLTQQQLKIIGDIALKEQEIGQKSKENASSQSSVEGTSEGSK